MSIPDGVVLPTTLIMIHGSLACTHLLISTFLGYHHSDVSNMDTFGQTMLTRDQYLEDYLPYNYCL